MATRGMPISTTPCSGFNESSWSQSSNRPVPTTPYSQHIYPAYLREPPVLVTGLHFVLRRSRPVFTRNQLLSLAQTGHAGCHFCDVFVVKRSNMLQEEKAST